MSGSQQLLLGGSVAVPVDPYFYSVTSLLHGDGTNGGQNNTFLDSSTNNFTITRNGNTTQGSFSPFSQTGWSNYFDGNGDYLQTPSGAASPLGTSSFTWECWIYRNAVTDATYADAICCVSTGTAGFAVGVNPDGRVGYAISSVGVWDIRRGVDPGDPRGSIVIPLNTWTHIALVRNGSTFTGYVNGAQDQTFTSSASISSISANYNIGKWHDANNRWWNGYISNFRFVIGTAVYTAAFTPPTTPLTAITNTSLLTCQSNRFRDASTNNFAITRNGDVSVQPFSPFNPTTAYSTGSIGGSGYFDGSGDSLTSTWSVIGSNQFTCEAWVYITEGSNRKYIVGPGVDTATHYDGFGFEIQGQTLNMWASSDGTSWNLVTSDTSQGRSANAVPLNSWNHVVMTRDSSGVFRSFINGKLECVVSPGTAALADASTTVLNLGRARYTGDFANFLGYISNFRIVNGSVVSGYSTSSTTVGTQIFTPPTTPLTAITNTSFLTNFTNGAIFDNAAVADYETAGNAQISTSVKKYGTGSIAFDGTGDYLVTYAPSTDMFAFGTGDFTVEFWYYSNNSGVQQILYDSRPSGTNGAYITFYKTSGNVLELYVNTGVRLTGTITLSSGVWYHVALCRVASQTKIFVNGTQSGPTYADTTTYLNGANRPVIGSDSATVGNFPINGYIDDLRISKGIARYTYNFTPPTAEFPNIGGTITLTADPYYEYTTLLLPGNGTNGAQNNTFLDSSTNAFTITRNGNTTQGTFSPFSQTGWGNYFNGSTDSLSLADNAAWNMGSGDFTAEAWIYPTSFANEAMIMGQWSGATGGTTLNWALMMDAASAGSLRLITSSNGSSVLFDLSATSALTLNQWQHIAAVRSGTTFTIYVNGTARATTTNASALFDATNNFTIGVETTTPTQYYQGYISNLRITKGGALYTANFTPSTTPLTTTVSAGTVSLLTCQSNRFLDSSSNAFAITVNGSPSVQAFSPFNPTAAWSAATYGGSGYFDGSGDYLTTPSNAALAFGSGDFTLEFWIYITAHGGTDGRPLGNHNGWGANAWSLHSDHGTQNEKFSFWVNNYNASVAMFVSTTTATLNTWFHVAVTRSGNSWKMFINGTQEGGTVTSSVALDGGSSDDMYIGGSGSANEYVTGYMSSVRALKGTALYTSNFTPPTSPLTAITNTQLLLSYTNAGIYDATSKNDLETVGNAQISTTQSKFGGSSMYFDGTGDSCRLPIADNKLQFGTGDFTIEGWVYSTNGTGTYQHIITGGTSWTSGSGGVYWYYGAGSPYIGAAWNQIATNPAVNSGTLATNTWHHFAITRYGNTLTLYVNGFSVDTLALAGSDSLALNNQSRTNIGGGGWDNDFQGYINDLRVTKGIARYTSNFTPPTTAFLTL